MGRKNLVGRFFQKEKEKTPEDQIKAEVLGLTETVYSLCDKLAEIHRQKEGGLPSEQMEDWSTVLLQVKTLRSRMDRPLMEGHFSKESVNASIGNITTVLLLKDLALEQIKPFVKKKEWDTFSKSLETSALQLDNLMKAYGPGYESNRQEKR